MTFAVAVVVDAGAGARRVAAHFASAFASASGSREARGDDACGAGADREWLASNTRNSRLARKAERTEKNVQPLRLQLQPEN